MKYSLVGGLLFVALVAASSSLLLAQQPRGGAAMGATPPNRRNAPTGTGVIAGRVFDASTNAPIRRAQIQATNNELFVDGLTNDEGRFQLTNLPPGEWRVTVTKGGYFPWQLGQRRPFEAASPITLARGQRLTGDVPLTRGGVILGRVSDATGEPLAGLRVRVYRARMSQGYRRLEDVGVADFTDDRGAYRIYGLPPGDYYVAASLRVAPAGSVVQTTYSPTYYPGTADLADAQLVRVELGSETTAMFSLMPVRSVTVTGSVLTSSGSPANAFLNLVSESSELGIPLGIGGVTQPDGTFTLPDVPPGRYTLNASLRGDGPSESGSLPLVVDTADLPGNILVTGRPATITGRFVVDAGSSRVLPGGELSVAAVAARPGGIVMSSGSGTSFDLDDLVEPFNLRVSGLPEGWSVKAIVVDGSDVTDTRIVPAPSQQSDARIILTDRLTHISGTAMVSGQSAAAEVVVFADDVAKWTYPSRFVRATTADETGRFRISGLPGGTRYLAIATSYLDEGEHNDPEFLGRMRDVAVRFDIADAETLMLDLKVLER
jgi:hypothetical protein